MPEQLGNTKGGLGWCHSAPHRSVLGLTRVAMGHTVDRSLRSDLEASDPEDLVRIATFNYVHVILATAFERTPELADTVPRDLVIFFEEMQQANLRRNRHLTVQLREVGAVLADAGLQGVALKGGAELLAPLHTEPAFRFLSDLDILLPKQNLDAAVEALRRTGARSKDVDEINARDHHHVAPLRHPDWLIPVELHRALAPREQRSILCPDLVLARARPSGLPGLCVPVPADRLIHAVLHAQFSPPRYRDGLLSLRDIVEMDVLLRKLTKGEISRARARFHEPEARAAWAALDAVRTFVLGDADATAALSPAAQAWAERAVTGFGRPGRRRASALLGWATWFAKEALVNPERRAHYLRKARRPGAVSRALAEHKENWRRTR